MKAGFVQTRPEFGKVKENVDSALDQIAILEAGLVVLPELFTTGYQFRTRQEALKLAEPAEGGYTAGRLTEAAKKKKMHIVAGFAERDGKKVYNSSMLVGPRGVIGVYRKAHLFWDEKKIFNRGDSDFKVYRVAGVKLGMMICFDWIFPEVARTLALRGAEIICQPSNLVLPYCPQAMITRSLENRVFSITANRVGTEERVKGKRLHFIGTSQIVSPGGSVLCRASGDRVAAASMEIDPSEARNKNITPVNNIFKDRRKSLFDL